MFPYRRPDAPPEAPPDAAAPTTAPRVEDGAMFAVLALTALACIARVVLALAGEEHFSSEPTLALLAAVVLVKLALGALRASRPPR